MDKLNIVLFTIDAMRPDYLGCYGGNVSSPNIDALAKNGVIFENAFTHSPYTPFAFPAIFTGRYTREVLGSTGKLSSRYPLLAEFFRSHGLRTIGISSNHFLLRGFGYDRGFEIYYDINDFTLPQNRLSENLSEKFYLILSRIFGAFFRLFSYNAYPSAKQVTQKVIIELSRVHTPFFLWVHFMDTHGPYKLKEKPNLIAKFRSEYLWYKATRHPADVSEREIETLKKSYINCVKFVDDSIGTIIDFIKRAGFYENTVFIITADHGEEFSEHGGFSHNPQKLYEELIRIPLIISGESLKPKRIKEPVTNLDLFPTLIGLAGSKSHFDFVGENLADVIYNGNPLTRKEIIIEGCLLYTSPSPRD